MKTGYIDIICDDYFECKLSEDGELDYILTVPNVFITPEQLKLVKMGRIVRYDMEKDELYFPEFPPLTEEQIQNAMDRADETAKFFSIKNKED
jgi:hypothetical protein